jgi:hypothetical protein
MEPLFRQARLFSGAGRFYLRTLAALGYIRSSY